MIMPRRTTRRQAVAAAACARSAALERVHSAPGLLAAILTHLKKPTDLNSAAASCHAWREAGLSEDVDVSFWRVMSEAFPLVAVLKARPDCIYTWRQLYVQRVVADRQTMLLSDGTVAPSSTAVLRCMHVAAARPCVTRQAPSAARGTRRHLHSAQPGPRSRWRGVRCAPYSK